MEGHPGTEGHYNNKKNEETIEHFITEAYSWQLNVMERFDLQPDFLYGYMSNNYIQ